MAGIPNLWPADIKTDVLSPVAVLRHQAGQLRQQTKGLLEAQVATDEGEKGRISHRFLIVAPALNRATFALFTAEHHAELIYPVRMQFRPWTDEYEDDKKAFAPTPPIPMLAPERPNGDKSAADQSELIHLLKQVLSAPYTRSILTSLIAKTNELPSSSPAPPKAGELGATK